MIVIHLPHSLAAPIDENPLISSQHLAASGNGTPLITLQMGKQCLRETAYLPASGDGNDSICLLQHRGVCCRFLLSAD